MTQSIPLGTYAVIQVDHRDGTVSYPVVERVVDGWQSGVMHYDDVDVLDVTLLRLVVDGEAS